MKKWEFLLLGIWIGVLIGFSFCAFCIPSYIPSSQKVVKKIKLNDSLKFVYLKGNYKYSFNYEDTIFFTVGDTVNCVLEKK